MGLCVVVALLSGCASGPKFSKVSNSIPALPSDQGRIFVYRKTSFGAAVQPAVLLNKEPIGTAKPKGCFYVDRSPGNYQISTSTEVKRTLSMTLEKGETRYVRLNVSMGFWIGHVFPELIEPHQGEKEIQSCHFLGALRPSP